MIIVTGGAGFIGSCLVWKLNSLGHRDVLVVDEQGQTSPKLSNWNPSQSLGYMDKEEFIRKVRCREMTSKVDAVFHMGACSSTTEQNRDYLHSNNFSYTQTLAEWCLASDIPFLYASSAATYGDGQQGYSDAERLTPGLKPLNPYGESKQMFDEWVLEKGLSHRFTGFKFFNVYGPNEYHKADMRSMVHKGYQQVKKEGKLRLFKSYRPDYKDGEQKRDFIYVKDVVEAMIWFWKNPKYRGIYNLGTGRAESWNDLAHAIFLALGIPPQIEYIEMPLSIRNQYQYWTQADLTKLQQTGIPLHFLSLKEGVADYVSYLESSNPYLTAAQPQRC